MRMSTGTLTMMGMIIMAMLFTRVLSFGFWSRYDASLVPAIRGKSFSERVEMVLTMVSVNVAVIMF